jgi:hypothetical protein
MPRTQYRSFTYLLYYLLAVTDVVLELEVDDSNY